MDSIIAINSGVSASYGDDEWSSNLQTKLSEIFETEVSVFSAVTGTASNALALAALTPCYGKIYCHDLSHINTDECCAPEFFTGGAKLIPLKGNNGKITADDFASAIHGAGNVHNAQPATISITQACEAGTIYQTDEISAIAAVGHEQGLSVHMDGARFANAIVALGVSPAEMTWKAGVDVLSFGGTKNGCIAAEAVVFFKPDMAENFQYLHKRSGQLLSKSRYVSMQLEAYLSDGVWLRNALQANTMASLLSKGLSAFPDIELAYPTQSNEVFVRLPRSVIDLLNGAGYDVNEDELDCTAARFVTAWNTEPNDIEQLLAVIGREYSNP
jgi:threonine aldolase